MSRQPRASKLTPIASKRISGGRAALEPAVGKPLARNRPDLTLLARPDRGEGPEHVLSRRPAHDPRLHLAEDEKARIPRNHVELPIPGTEVPLDHLIPPRLEMPGGELLATSAEPAPGVSVGRHQRPARSQPPSSRRTR